MFARRCFLPVILLLLPLCVYGQRADPNQVMADLRAIQKLYPRTEGSQAEGELLQFIEQRLEQLQIPHRRFDFLESDLTHSFSTCLEATISGKVPDTLILAVPLNHPLSAEPNQDGSINIALALNILEQLRVQPPPLTVRVLFLGAEYGKEPEYPMGSRLFLRDFFPEHRVIALYLNFKGIPSRLFIRGGGRGVEAPYWLIDRCTKSLRKAEIYFLLRGNENQIFRIGLTSEKTIIEPFLQAGYPALSLEGEYRGRPDQAAWIFSFSLFFNGFVNAFSDGIPETWDRHYLFFQMREFYFSVPEKVYITALILILAVSLLYSLIYSQRLRKYIRTLYRNFWSIPVFFGISFLLLFAASWALEGILKLRNIVDLWTAFPLLFLSFKLILPFLVLMIFYRGLRRIPFTRNGSFYSAASLLFLLVDIVILAIINISFTYYFLWAYIFALFFSITRRKTLKVLFFLVSPYWILKIIVELFTLPRLAFCQVLLFSKLWGNVLLALVFLPFLLMFLRLRLILPPIRRMRVKTRHLAGLLIVLVLLVGHLALFMIYSPYGGKEKQQIVARYLVDRIAKESTLSLNSPAALGHLRIWDTENLVTIDSRSRSYVLPLPEIPELLQSSIESTGFLDRKNLKLILDPTGSPRRFRLTLRSPEEFVLFDSNFPYIRETGGRVYDLLVGVNPPLPLEVELTLPKGRTFELSVEVEYLNNPADFRLFAPDKILDTIFTLRDRLEIKT